MPNQFPLRCLLRTNGVAPIQYILETSTQLYFELMDWLSAKVEDFS